MHFHHFVVDDYAFQWWMQLLQHQIYYYDVLWTNCHCFVANKFRCFLLLLERCHSSLCCSYKCHFVVSRKLASLFVWWNVVVVAVVFWIKPLDWMWKKNLEDIVDGLNSMEDLMRGNMWKKVGRCYCCCWVHILQPAQIGWQNIDEIARFGPSRSPTIHWLHNRQSRNLLIFNLEKFSNFKFCQLNKSLFWLTRVLGYRTS